MSAPKKPSTLTKRGKNKAVTMAKTLSLASKVADQALTTSSGHRALTAELAEIVLQRVSAGDTVRYVCDELGLASGLVYQRAYYDAEYGKRLRAAWEICTHSQVDSMLLIACDDTKSVEERRLIIDTIWKLAKARARDHYGERPLINAEKLTIQLSNDDLDIAR